MTLDDAKRDKGLLLQTLGVEQALNDNHINCSYHSDRHGSLRLKQMEDGVWTFRCMQPDCPAADGGTIVDALMLTGLPMGEAMRQLQGEDFTPPKKEDRKEPHYYHKPGENGSGRRQGDYPEPNPDPDKISEYQAECNARLLYDDSALEFLLRTRGITQEVAEEYGLGVDDIRFSGNSISCCRWVMPINHPEKGVLGIKLHWQNPGEGELKYGKCIWKNCGATKSHAYLTLWPAPEEFDKSEMLYLNPGELKALGVRTMGYPSTAITGGEAWRWSPGSIDRLRGRKVCILYDDDKAGIEFMEHSKKALEPVCADLIWVSVEKIGVALRGV